MSVWQALVLSIIQGILEFLPLSSTGGVILFGNMMNVESQNIIFLIRYLRIGTLLATILYFRKDIYRLTLAFYHTILDILDNFKIYRTAKKARSEVKYHKLISDNYRKIVVMVFIALIPTLLVVLLFQKFTYSLYENMLASSLGFFVTAILYFVVYFYKSVKVKTPKESTYYEAAVIGCFHGASFLPGLTRLGSTLSACYLFGFSKKYAVKLSFLLAVPTLLGAIIFHVPAAPGVKTATVGVSSCIIAVVVSAFIGYMLIHAIIRILQTSKFHIFAILNIIMAIGCLMEYL